MDDKKAAKHLEFLKVAVPKANHEAVFMEKKRDVRKSLFQLLQPAASKIDLWSMLTIIPNTLEASTTKKQHVEDWFLHFCPNPPFTKIVQQLQRKQLYKLDTHTVQKLAIFRRPPSSKELKLLLHQLHHWPLDWTLVALERLIPFGRELQPYIIDIQLLVESNSIEIAQKTIELIPHIPQGIEQSATLLWRTLETPALRFYALKAFQKPHTLSFEFLSNIFRPILKEYERLSRDQGPKNDLWEEINIIRSILFSNGGKNTIIFNDINL